MKAENDPDFYHHAYWLDEKTGTLVMIVSKNVNGGAVFTDDSDRRKKYLDVQYVSAGPMGTRFRVSVSDMRERFKPMGPNPVYLRSEKRWEPTKKDDPRKMRHYR